MTEKYKVMIVDDHAFFRKGVMFAVNRIPNFEVIDEAASGAELLRKIENNTPDIVLLDINMPDLSGIETTQRALAIEPNLKIIALTMHGEEAYVESMLNAGAMGYMLKSSESDDLERALLCVAAGNQLYSSEILPQLTKRFLNKPHKQDLNKLTKRELEVLNYIFKGYSNKEIAEALFVSLRTITTHRTNLNSKTGAKNTATLIAYALKNNLVEL